MLENRQDKNMVVILAAVLGLLLAYVYLWTPYREAEAAVSQDITDETPKLLRAQRLVRQRHKADEDFQALLADSLKTDAAAAESQALHAMRKYADDSRIDLQALRPERIARMGDFQQVRILASGNASTSGLSNLLWQIESAKLPMRVTDLRLTARKEGTDDLSFALTVSALVFSPAPEAKQPAARAAAEGESR